jgi:phage terminase large subunit
MAAHDPSDQGGDAKSYVERQGSVIIEALEQPIMNVNEGCDWATGMANQRKVDHFTWDGDGLGASLAAQISKAFVNTHTKVAMYRGSEGVDYPNAMSSQILSIPIHGLRKNKDIIKNKRAQYYLQFRERCYKTYRRVVHGEEYPIEELISFSSEIKLLSKLKSEVCRMPIKPNANGLFQLYTKEEMKKSFKINSPNLADGVVMTLRLVNTFSAPKHIPPAIRPIGIGRR